MRDNFNKAFELVIGSEGGFQNDPSDRGNWSGGRVGVGENRGTKYGISTMSYKSLDIKNITLDQARAIYKKDYWDRNQCDKLPGGVDYMVFDISVNHGVKDGATFLQRAVGSNPDGDIGPATLRAVGLKKPKDILKELSVVRLFDYLSLKMWPRFGLGWSRRLMEVLVSASEMLDSSASHAVIDEPILRNLTGAPTLDQSKAGPTMLVLTKDTEPEEVQSRWASLWKRVR